ncbi:MAG: putative hemolysin [Chloroflexia bacterium]
MIRKLSLLMLVALLCLLPAACGRATPPTSEPTATPGGAGIANPAAAYCEQQVYRWEVRTAPDGSQSGVCIFPNGHACDEWAFFRGECGPDQATPYP